MQITIQKPGSYIHQMEIIEGGKMAILAGVGPMGLAAINYVVSREDRKPSLLVVTDIAQDRLDRAAEIFPLKWAKENGIELVYLNTGNVENPVEKLKEVIRRNRIRRCICFCSGCTSS